MADWCPACGDWPIASDDRFCGECGAFVLPVKADFKSDVGTEGGAGITFACAAEGDLTGLRLGFFQHRDGRETRIDVELAPALDTPDIHVGGATRLVRYKRPMSLVARVLTADGYASNIIDCLTANQPASRFGTPLTLLDPAALRRGDDGAATLSAPIVNCGGPARVNAARIRLDSTLAEDQPPPRGRPVLVAGEGAKVEAWVSPEDFDTLTHLKGSRQGSLELFDDKTSLAKLPIRFDQPGPAAVEFVVASGCNGLASRRLRLAAMLENIGGRTVRVTSLTAQFTALYGGGMAYGETPFIAPVEWELGVAPGRRCYAELRPELRVGAAALPKGKYICAISLTYVAHEAGADREPIRAVAEVEVFDRAFEGRLCIDFGTTETGAAAIGGAEPTPRREGRPAAPKMIDLGRVGLPGHLDSAERFLATRVVEVDGVVLTGEAAERVTRRDEAERAVMRDAALRSGATLGETREITFRAEPRVFDKLKWERDEGSQARRIKYLECVRELIEEHPQIAATIDTVAPIEDTAQAEKKVTVFATRPAEFEDREDLLIRAFEAAGFGRPTTRIFNPDVDSLISESWSPLPFLLISPDDPGVDPLESLAAPGRDLGERDTLPWEAGKTGHVVIYDIGGGSADLSVLQVEDEADIRRVTDISTLTNEDFAGRRFAELIEECLLRAGRRALGRTGHMAKADDADGRARWREATAAVQHAPGGLLSPFRNEIGSLFNARRKNETEADLSQAVKQRLLGIWDDKKNSEERRDIARHLPLRLPFDDGSNAELGVSDLADLITDVINSFAKRYLEPVRRITERLREKANVELAPAPGAQANPRVRLLFSGRGARCVLAEELLLVEWSGTRLLRMVSLEAKSITSWGGLYLADLTRLLDEIVVVPPENHLDLYVRRGMPGQRLAPLRMVERDGLYIAPAVEFGGRVWTQLLVSIVRIPRGGDVQTEVKKQKLDLPSNPARPGEGLWLIVWRDGGGVFHSGVEPAATEDEAVRIWKEKQGATS